jgi:hypothetical protein
MPNSTTNIVTYTYIEGSLYPFPHDWSKVYLELLEYENIQDPNDWHEANHDALGC